jgi:hypothetical protein
MQMEEPPFLTPANFSAESKDVPAKKKKTTGENFYLKARHHNHFDMHNYQCLFSDLPISMHFDIPQQNHEPASSIKHDMRITIIF